MNSSRFILNRLQTFAFKSGRLQSTEASVNMAAQKQFGKVYVIGVGMTKFEKPGRRDNFDYPDMVKESLSEALKDAKVDYSQIEQAAVGYVYGDSTCGQRAIYQFGLTGIPVYNVNNNCATGSTALFMAHNFVKSGMSDCVLALGFEKMQKGSLGSQFDDRTNPIDKHMQVMLDTEGFEPAPPAAQMFGNAGREHMRKYGTTKEQLAKIAEKNHRHSVNNPKSQFQDEYSLKQILDSPTVHDPLTKLQCCPTSDGSAAAILASEKFVAQHGLQDNAIEILGMEMATDFPSTFNEKSCLKMVGFDMTKNASERLFNKTGMKPTDVDVVELHDCFSANELITYEGLGLCPIGKAGEMVDRGDNTYGGKYVVNPSGGLISKGHPLGATGLAQCTELCLQLRGQADKRQVSNARIGLQHNLGLGGAVVVGLYKKGFNTTSSAGVRSFSTNARKFNTDDNNNNKMVAETEGFKSKAIFDGVKEALASEGEELVKKVKGIFAFKVKGPNGNEGVWIVDAKNGKGEVAFNGKQKADVTLTISDEDLFDLMMGKLNAQKAFFQGKLKIQGNMGLAMKMQEFQKRAQDTMKSKL